VILKKAKAASACDAAALGSVVTAAIDVSETKAQIAIRQAQFLCRRFNFSQATAKSARRCAETFDVDRVK
jgi:hypothetical protein